MYYATDFNDPYYIRHYGVGHDKGGHSGRYPWGSGDDPYQRAKSFLDRIDEEARSGKSEKEIAESMNMNTSQLRIQKSLARNEKRGYEISRAKALREKGYSLQYIAEKMGYNNESSIRSLLNADSEQRMLEAENTAAFLKEQINKKGMIDVGKGVAQDLNISEEKLKQALYILELEGYPTYKGNIEQITNQGKFTTQRVVCPPGTEHKEIYNFDKIHNINEYISKDDGVHFDTYEYPKSMDSSRLKILYAEDGGGDNDGLIMLRRGVKDLDLGNDLYSQVRILVDDNKYLKGMAVYGNNEDFPDGIDVIFNSSKSKEKGIEGSLKSTEKNLAKDPMNPFGSAIKKDGGQSHYIDENGERQLSLINKRAGEGDWSEWQDSVPSQFLSKQSISTAKKQLKLAIDEKNAEFEEICSLTNPTVKNELLMNFSRDCDSAAVHLKAAAFPRQKYKIILPLNSLSDDEVYAPSYNNGEKLALVRYPHQGTYEIPIVTVNNKKADAKKLFGNLSDAIAINKNNAEILSGADFDGDTVMCIPLSSKVKISNRDILPGLKGFDAKSTYAKVEGMNIMSEESKGRHMGIITNLITDMTIKGANDDELAAATRHALVVIDAPKHELNWKQSEIDNHIDDLKKKYQANIDENGNVHYGGASTIISRAKSEQRVRKWVGTPKIDENTGELIYRYDDKDSYVDRKTGETKYRLVSSTKMYEAKDARTLTSGSGYMMEELYADYANSMKALGNKARKETLKDDGIPYSPSAAKTYSEEVVSLNEKLRAAIANAPRERQAQRIATTELKNLEERNPKLKEDKKQKKKVAQRLITSARDRVSASSKDVKVHFTDREWEAIQQGAITKTKLKQLLSKADLDEVRQLATPKPSRNVSQAQASQMKSMNSAGYTIAEIADRFNVSPTTVSKYLRSS